jgi:hypothetical protein
MSGSPPPKLSPSLKAELSLLGDFVRMACNDGDPLLVCLNMCLHLCCLASLALLQVWLGEYVGAHKTLISCANISSECMK